MNRFLLLIFVACGPPPPSGPDAGVDGGCRDAAKTPPNLLQNPGFECDSTPPEWKAANGTLELVGGGRTGRAAKVTMTNALGGRFTYAQEFAVDAGTKTFCFSAWLTGTAPFMRMRVLRVENGGVREVPFSEQVFPDWKRIPTLEVANDNAPKLQLIFEVQTNRTDGQNAMPGDTMLIDDVDVWESSTRCNESR